MMFADIICRSEATFRCILSNDAGPMDRISAPGCAAPVQGSVGRIEGRRGGAYTAIFVEITCILENNS